MPRVKVTGYLEVEDEDIDTGPSGPLTQEAFERFALPGGSEYLPLDDLEFEADDE